MSKINDGGPVTCAGYAMWDYKYADAMLAARTKGGDADGGSNIQSVPALRPGACAPATSH